MSCEIELKLRLTPVQARRLTAHPMLAGIAPEKSRLFNTYYDTPGLELKARGIALRLRRKGWSTWLMTVKGGDAGAGGLAQRHEWEAPTHPGVFDFGIVDLPELRAFLEERRERLLPVFTTDFTRTAWLLKTPGSAIELALDRGKISATRLTADRSTVTENLCELELELVEGVSTDPLFDAAIGLAADFQLHPEIRSKAERGYSLAMAATAAPAKGFGAAIERRMTSIEAFRSIASTCLVQLQRNEAGAVAGDNPEYIHQARVAIRRLRSAFRLFAPLLAPAFLEVYPPRWKALAAQLGGARDWDVFLAETLKPLEEVFPDNADLAYLRARAEECRQAAGSSAADALSQREYSRLLLAFTAALLREAEPTIARDASDRAPENLRHFAARRLRKRWEAIAALTRQPGRMEAAHHHRLRIEFKKLRYALEFFAPILPRKRVSGYLQALAAIQEQLGRLNDQVTAQRLIEDLHPGHSPDSLVVGLIAGRTQLLLTSLEPELKRFLSRAKPW